MPRTAFHAEPYVARVQAPALEQPCGQSRAQQAGDEGHERRQVRRPFATSPPASEMLMSTTFPLCVLANTCPWARYFQVARCDHTDDRLAFRAGQAALGD